MSDSRQEIAARALERRRRRAEKRGAPAKSPNKFNKMLVWSGLVAGAIVLSISSLVRWATGRKAADGVPESH